MSNNTSIEIKKKRKKRKYTKRAKKDKLARLPDDTRLKRQTALLLRQLQGVQLKDAIKQIAFEYGVSEESVKWDWRSRDKWLPQVADAIDPKALIAEVWATDKTTQSARRSTLFQIDKLIEGLRDKEGKLDSSPNSPLLSLLTLRERYLKALSEGNKSMLENAIRSGILREQPSRVIVDKRELSGTIDFNKLLGDMSESEREQFLSKLEKAFEKRDQ